MWGFWPMDPQLSFQLISNLLCTPGFEDVHQVDVCMLEA